MNEAVCWLNGELITVSEARISPLDRGLLYGDGLFETMRAYGGAIFRLGAHVERLLGGAEALKFPFTLDARVLVEACEQVVVANELTQAYVRLTVTRGVGGLPSELDASPTPTVLVIAREFHGYPTELYESGMSVSVAAVRRNASSPLSRIKSLSYLDNLLMRAAAAEAGTEEALTLDFQGHVVEGSASNIFLVKHGGVLTPPVTAGVLPGITRDCVLELCPNLHIAAAETMFSPEELARADEAFLTNSLMEVMPLTEVKEAPIGGGRPGPLTKRLASAYCQLVARETGST